MLEALLTLFFGPTPAIIFSLPLMDKTDFVNGLEFSFDHETEICIRVAYSECELGTCTSISEGSIAFDMESDNVSQTLVFSGKIAYISGKKPTWVTPLPSCTEISQNEIVRVKPRLSNGNITNLVFEKDKKIQ